MTEFLKETIRYPKLTGAIAPSSKRLAELITNKARLDTAEFVVEIGPGTGVFTKYIISKLGDSKNFFTIEINPKFVKAMQAQFPAVTTYQDSATNINALLAKHGRVHCDRIISGLPWAAFEDSLQEEILENIYQALEIGGMFLTFAYSPFNHLKNGRAFKAKLDQKFSSVEKTKKVLNIPNAFVYVCTK